ncbi:GDSL-type esterase/lipase family protein, partial [Sulfurimonas sp.]|nr:GDSL-type esterase/lipase family protein [Sulfurimonas sp.]
MDKGTVILAFGDSLTYGYGVSKELSYPSQLQKKTSLHVINAGISGEESTQGLKRLPKLLKQSPDIVILCHGGNDILRKRSLTQLKQNLKEMVILIRRSGAKVLLVGVPSFGLFGFDTVELYDELAD